MSIVTELGDRIANLTSAEATGVLAHLKEKYGIEPAGGGVKMVPQQLPGQNDNTPTEAAPTEFDVIYEGFDPSKKMDAIKNIREALGLGLIDAKNMVENGAGKKLKEAVSKDAAEELNKKLTAAGCKIAVKPA